LRGSQPVGRIKAIAKSLDLPVIVSDDFAHAHGGALKSLGRHQLRGWIHDGCGFLDNIDPSAINVELHSARP